jgi:hypothetical protein
MFGKITQLVGASLFVVWIIFSSCGKKEITASTPGALPTVESVNVFELTGNTVKAGCIVRNSGRAQLLEAGICWGTNSEPTTADKAISLTTTLGTFTRQITALESGTVYYFRAYATNSLGTSYSDQQMVTTLSSWKEVTSSQLIINSAAPALAASGSTIFLHDTPNSVYRSTDNGTTWSLFNSGLSGMTSKGLMTVTQQSVVIVEYTGKAYASSISSNGWKVIAPAMTGNEANDAISAIAIKDNNLIVAKPNYGLFYASIDASGWSMVNYSDFTFATINSLAVKGSSLLVGSSYGNRFYRSTDLSNWDKYTGSIFNSLGFNGISVNGDDIFTSTNYYGNYVSSDNGITWTATEPASNFYYRFGKFAFGGNNIVGYATSNGIKVSTNKGLSWADYYEGLPTTTSGNIGIVASSNYFFTVVNKTTSYKLYRRKY